MQILFCASGHLIHAARRRIEEQVQITLSLDIEEMLDLIHCSHPMQYRRKKKDDCDRKQMREGEKKEFLWVLRQSLLNNTINRACVQGGYKPVPALTMVSTMGYSE